MATAIFPIKYEYMDTTSIDKDLYCDYCNNPLVDPVSTPCKHRFCRMCIEEKLKNRGGACLKPKCPNRSMTLNDLKPINERFIINLLDRLLVKCSICGTKNIERGSFAEHATTHSFDTSVNCLAVDLQCSWIGSSEELARHISTCTYERLRPILSDIIQDAQELNDQIQQTSERCLEHYSSCSKDLENIDRCITSNAEQFSMLLNDEKIQILDLENELRQLKESLLQETVQIQQLKGKVQYKKDNILHLDECAESQQLRIDELTNKLNVIEN